MAALSHDYYFLSVFQNTLISEWKTRVDELKMENDYQWRLKILKYEEQVKDLTDKYMYMHENISEANNEILSKIDKHMRRELYTNNIFQSYMSVMQ